MLNLPASVEIYISNKPVDMRKGFDGLSAIVRNQFGRNIFSGHLFVFLSKSLYQVKILWWERGGLAIYSKRLEKGRFKLPDVKDSSTCVSMDTTELSMLLDGIDFNKVKRPKHWEPPKQSAM